MNPDDEDFRVPVAPELQAELRLYRRLWLALVDLEESKAAADEILRLRIPIPKNDRPPPLLLALTTAMVVAYARPWVHSRGQSVAARTVPGQLLRCLTSKQRSLHDYLIQHRNLEIAHADADVLDLHVRLFPDGDSAILRTSREAFLRSELRMIRRNIEKLEAAIADRCAELKDVLPNGVWI